MFADSLSGDAASNAIDANGGDDTASGGNGADTVEGGDGADVLAGDGGRDVLRQDASPDADDGDGDTLFGVDGEADTLDTNGDDVAFRAFSLDAVI